MNRKEYQKEWYKKNKAKKDVYYKEWKKKNSAELKEYQKTYRMKNPGKSKLTKEQWRAYDLKKFNLTNEDYNQMFDNQGGNCAICGKHQSEFKKSLAVDHCHTTSKVRGLLCNNCNLGLGNFKDEIEFLANAITYLTKK